MAQASANISKKRKHVAEGVFKAELDGYLRKVSFLLHYERLCFFRIGLVFRNFEKLFFLTISY